jgi:hypothetical protein
MAVGLSALRAGRDALFYTGKIPDTHFCQSLSRPHGHSSAGRIRSIEKSNDLIGTRYLPACSIVPQPTTLPIPAAMLFRQQLRPYVLSQACQPKCFPLNTNAAVHTHQRVISKPGPAISPSCSHTQIWVTQFGEVSVAVKLGVGTQVILICFVVFSVILGICKDIISITPRRLLSICVVLAFDAI